MTGLWVPGLITVASVGVLVALVARMIRQGDQTVSLVRTLVVALLGALLGFFVSVVIQNEWRLWYACAVEVVTATLALMVATGRGDDVADREEEVERERAALGSGRGNAAITQRSRR